MICQRLTSQLFLCNNLHMKQNKFSISPELLAHAEAMVKSGRYANVSAYIQALIQRDQEREEANAWLYRVHREAIDSGEPVDIDPEHLGTIVERGIERARHDKSFGEMT